MNNISITYLNRTLSLLAAKRAYVSQIRRYLETLEARCSIHSFRLKQNDTKFYTIIRLNSGKTICLTFQVNMRNN